MGKVFTKLLDNCESVGKGYCVLIRMSNYVFYFEIRV